MIACTVLKHNCTKAVHANACRQKQIQTHPGAASATKCESQHCQSGFHQVQVCISSIILGQIIICTYHVLVQIHFD